MSDHPAARASDNPDAYRGLRILALTAVAIGVILLAAAAFALSYAGIHAIALQAGVSKPLARLYPLILDAMLVVGGAAVLSLRGAGLVTRCYAWLTVLVLLAAAAGADALHATATRLPHRSAAATVAIIPWALVLIGFALLLAMLRHARLRRAAANAPRIAPHGQARAHWQPTAGSPPASAGSPPAALPPGGMSGPAPRPAAAPVPVQASAVVLPGAPLPAGRYGDADEDPIRYGQPYPRDPDASGPADAGLPAAAGLPANSGFPADAGLAADSELAVDADAGQDDPTSDEARAVGLSAAPWVPRPREEASAGRGHEYPAGTMSAAPTPEMSAAPTPDPQDDADDDADPAPSAMPHFDRMQSSPTPPAD
jgi:hypothetical protein